MLDRIRKWVVVTAIGTFASGPARTVEGSAYNVYYRADAGSPWVFYAGKATGAAADAVVADLQATGYSARVVPGNLTPDGTAGTVTSQTVAQTGPVISPYGGGASSTYFSTWGGSPGYSYSGGYSYGGGGFRHADNWHHHEHSHEGEHRGDAGRHHPTPHPHRRAAAPHAHHAPAHHAAHHGAHHGHSHSHSHAHHGRK